MSGAAQVALEVVKTAGRLLPDFIDWVGSMLKVGRSEDEMRRDIKDRRAEVERMWARHQEELDKKHGSDR